MNKSTEHPTPELLQQLHRMEDLSSSTLRTLAKRLYIQSAPRGVRLMEIGYDEDTTFYLLRGKVELLPADGHRRIVIGGTAEAQRSLCRLRPNRYRVTTLSPVSYLLIDNVVLEDYLPLEDSSSFLLDDNYQVSETSLSLHTGDHDLLMREVMNSLNRGTLVVPSLARVAVKVGLAMLNAAKNPYRLSKVLMIDPTLSIKVMKAANTNQASNGTNVKTCQQAINRLGPEKVVALAVNCALRESIKPARPEINARFQIWWERSLRVSAISNFLASMNNRFDPDLAALAGLLHRIGEVVLLYHADSLKKGLDRNNLDNALTANTREMGRILLTMWNLPIELMAVVSESGNLMRDHEHGVDYADLVLVAERHADIGNSANRRLVSPDRMPAFHRLGLNRKSTEFSLQMVRFGQNALDQAKALLAA